MLGGELGLSGLCKLKGILKLGGMEFCGSGRMLIYAQRYLKTLYDGLKYNILL
jgi:hypothetical protein